MKKSSGKKVVVPANLAQSFGDAASRIELFDIADYGLKEQEFHVATSKIPAFSAADLSGIGDKAFGDMFR
jgi:hypothetical protein